MKNGFCGTRLAPQVCLYFVEGDLCVVDVPPDIFIDDGCYLLETLLVIGVKGGQGLVVRLALGLFGLGFVFEPFCDDVEGITGLDSKIFT